MAERKARDVDDPGFVEVGEHRIPGFVDRRLRCSECGGHRIYHELYDAYMCPACNIWLEGRCGDPDCDFCRRRPDRPLPEEHPFWRAD